MITSGDQSIFWDAPLKLFVLSQLVPHRHIRHLVHTADLFSRHGNVHTAKETQRGAVIASPEVYNPDGNINRWSATCEGAYIFGRMPLHPKELTGRGVDLSRIATYLGFSLERVVHELSRGDWFGISYPDQRRVIAHNVPMEDIRDGIAHIRKVLRTNLSEALRDIPDADLGEFDRLFSIIEPNRDVHSWGEASVLALERTLRHLRVSDNVSVNTTFGLLSEKDIPKLLTLFVQRYDEMRQLYNEAVTADGVETILQLGDGELPFSAVIEDDGNLRRVDLHRQSGDSVSAVLKRASREGNVVGYIGKAIPNLLEMLLSGDLILMDKGSAYAPQALAFGRSIERHLGDRQFHKLLRLRVHALDALADVPRTFQLPGYLARAFGTEKITGPDFAHSWRKVQEEAKARADALSGTDYRKLLETLASRGTIGPKGRSLISELYLYEQSADNAIRMIREQEGTKDEKTARIRAEQERFNPDIQRALIRTAETAIDHDRAKLLADELKVADGLSYWNARPYSAWVFSVPGWREAIMKRAELVQESSEVKVAPRAESNVA